MKLYSNMYNARKQIVYVVCRMRVLCVAFGCCVMYVCCMRVLCVVCILHGGVVCCMRVLYVA